MAEIFLNFLMGGNEIIAVLTKQPFVIKSKCKADLRRFTLPGYKNILKTDVLLQSQQPPQVQDIVDLIFMYLMCNSYLLRECFESNVGHFIFQVVHDVEFI